MEKKIVAIFDFDDTLTTQDSFMSFFKFVVGKWPYYLGLIICSPILVAYFLKLLPNWMTKEIMLRYFLKGLSLEKLNNLGVEYASQIIPNLIRNEAIQRVKWHQQQNHELMIISASIENYLIPWGKANNFNYIICTKLQENNNLITGKIDGNNCYGDEKVKRLQEIINIAEYEIYAYGDSKGDLPLLNIANHSYYRKFSDE